MRRGHGSTTVLCRPYFCVSVTRRLDVLGDPAGIEPSDFLERLPQFAGLVDIDLAGLLGVGLAELLADAQGLDALDEDAALRGEVGRAVEP